MLFDKLIAVLKTILRAKSKKQNKRVDFSAKINYSLKNKLKKKDAMTVYKNDIDSLRELKLSTGAADGLIFDIHKDALSGTIDFHELSITESELNKLLKRQRAYNLRVRFNLLKEAWYRGIGGVIIIQEIEALINDKQITWKELKIDRAEFYSIKNHIKAAK